MRHLLGLVLMGLAVFVAGCPQPGSEIVIAPECEGKATVEEAIRVLALQEQMQRITNALPAPGATVNHGETV